jgi:hypothetical protein
LNGTEKKCIKNLLLNNSLPIKQKKPAKILQVFFLYLNNILIDLKNKKQDKTLNSYPIWVCIRSFITLIYKLAATFGDSVKLKQISI